MDERGLAWVSLTALIPLNCCPIVRTTTVMSCQRMLESVKSSQGFLATSPLRAKRSLRMSSNSCW